MTPGFWKGRRVFLTGHTGFKGAWLSLWLNRLGAKLSGYALEAPSNPNLFELARVDEGMDSERADINDLATLTAALKRAKPEIVIHMAAQALVRDSYADPVGTYATNVMGTVNLLEAVRHTESVRAALVVTSDKCYQNNGATQGFSEDDPLGGYDPYSSSKGAAELVTASYRSSFFHPDSYDKHGVAVASGRAGNVIGGGDWARDRLLPDIIRALLRGETPLLRSPHAVRPWQHVLEPLSGYLMLCERLVADGPAVAEGWNFGPAPGDARPVSWIADRLTSLWGEGASWTLENAPQPHEAAFLHLDTAKARQRLGYRPRWNLEHGLEATATWAKHYRDGADMREITVGQIDAFMDANVATAPRPMNLQGA